MGKSRMVILYMLQKLNQPGSSIAKTIIFKFEIIG